MKTTSPTSAELFISTGCQHCPVVLQALNENLKTGEIASLNITNIAIDNLKAEKLNIRSVPWFSLSNANSYMIFSGQHSPKEIQQWLAISKSENGMQEYISEHLKNGQLMQVVQAIQIDSKMFSHVIDMIKDEETSMDLRIGLDVLIENFSATEILQKYSDDLKAIALSNNTRLAIDALHYIASTGDIKNKEFLQNKTKNDDEQIKEAAIEALETLEHLIGD